MNTTIKIDFRPKKTDFVHIVDWLNSEYIDNIYGFNNNISSIEKSFDNKRMVIISVNKYPIGFITWELHATYSARVNIAEIHPAYRKFGYGKLLAKHLFIYLINNNILTVDLECSPSDSASFWKKLDFKEFPNNVRRNERNLELYQILVDCLKPVAIKETKSEIIELWNYEPFQTKDRLPDCQWQLKFIKGTKQLTKPIIFPCKYDWRIRWRKSDEIFFDEKIKGFDKIKIQYGKFQNEYRDYLIIENL